ncbi:MAG: hypothetical protein JOZ55_04685 [Alphaproteobacteria bacterium]|nr:hypothetical protein [Alphaproteobacteria bacterium]
MSLKAEDFDFITNFSTLWSVILGALLATLGGLAGGQLEWFFESRRRERDAALFFAEVLSTLKIILDLAADTRKIGDPYGPVTLRMLRSARREIDIYERNRETLYTLKKSDLRARVHTIVLRISMPLDGLFDSTTAIDALQAQSKLAGLPEEERIELDHRIAQIKVNRDVGFDFLMEASEGIKSLVQDLGNISREDFQSIERAVRNG